MTKQKIILIIISAVVLLSIVIGLGVAGLNIPYDKQIKLAYKFLNDGNYEEAILAFNKAIDIEPKRYEAYLGLSDVYIKQGDYEKAMEVLKRGLQETGNSQELQDKILELEKLQTDEKADLDSNSTQIDMNVGTLSLSDFTYEYEVGGKVAEMNEGAIGGMNLTAKINGPADVSGVLIANWKIEQPFTQDEINEQIEFYMNIWKEHGSLGNKDKIPFTFTQTHPVNSVDIGKKAYVLLVGYNEQEKAVGYAIVEEIIG